MRIQLATLAFALLLGLATQAHANLVVNGDFEESYLVNGTTPTGNVNGIPLASLTNPQWDVYLVYPGWTRADGAGIEVQAGSVVAPHSGNRYVELDSHPTTQSSYTNTTIAQNIATEVGKGYTLSFWYYARPYQTPTSGLPNSFGYTTDAIFYGFGSTSARFQGDPSQGWVHITTQYWASSTTSRLFFGGAGNADTYGGFIDQVELTAIPELDPKAGGTALVLLAGAIAVLTGRRRALV